MPKARTSTKPVSVQSIRQLRQAADALSTNADQQRQRLIEQIGLKRYIFNSLGAVAREPATNCQLLWPEGPEQVNDGDGIPVGDYVFRKAEERRELPQAVITANRRKYYL